MKQIKNKEKKDDINDPLPINITIEDISQIEFNQATYAAVPEKITKDIQGDTNGIKHLNNIAILYTLIRDNNIHRSCNKLCVYSTTGGIGKSIRDNKLIYTLSSNNAVNKIYEAIQSEIR